jgi:putative heme-binding domain-containing protein
LKESKKKGWVTLSIGKANMNLNKSLLTPFFCVVFFLGGGCKPLGGVEANEDPGTYSGDKFKEHIRSSEPLTPEDEKLSFKLPPGFEIELFAAEPDIGKPMNIAFDAKGRMWVTQSFEYPYAASSGNGHDVITILEDTNKDGKADRFTSFIDTLNIPIGILPFNDGAIAYSIPNIFKFSDTDADLKADKRNTLIGSFSYKDTHGMVNNLVRGYDGWVHACHGFNTSIVAGADMDSIKLVYGNTFRFRTDGSRVEQTTYGRINPFGLVYDEYGYMYSTDCHTSPLYQLIRGGDYAQWGKIPDIGFAPVMKPLEDEATALAGLAYYADTKFPEEYRRNFFIGDVVKSRVYRNSFSFKGSSPIGKKEADFILSEDPWFRPVDVKMGPDGALYIADFYNSIIGHSEVPLDHPKRDRERGRIWRVTYKGEAKIPLNLAEANVKTLLAALNEDNLLVRMTAADQLVDRYGPSAIEPTKDLLNKKEISPNQYIHCLWVLLRLDALTKERVHYSANHADPLIRLHTMRILAEIEDSDQSYFSLVAAALSDGDPHVKRAALDVLIKYPTITSLAHVLSTQQQTPDYDSHLVYTSRLTLRNLLRNKPLFDKVIAEKWEQKDAICLADVMVGVPSSESALFLFNYIDAYSLPTDNLEIAFQHIARYVPSDQLNMAINVAFQKKGNTLDSDFEIFKGLRKGVLQRGERENEQLIMWGKRLTKHLLALYPATNLLDNDTQVLSRLNMAIELAGHYKLASHETQVRAFLEDRTNLSINDPDWDTFIKIRSVMDLKAGALRALLHINPENNAEFISRFLHEDQSPLELRKRAAGILGEFSGPVITGILSSVDNAPSDLQGDIVVALATTVEGKDIIFQKVMKGEWPARLLVEPKVEERILLNSSSKQQREYKQLIADLNPGNQEKDILIDARFTAYNLSSKGASSKEKLVLSEMGRKVFLQNCSGCHSIGQEGGSIGPNLDGIGERGVKALTEKIVDPNRNISEAFRNYTIRLKDGKIMTGLYRRDEGEVMVFADMSAKEFVIAKMEIAERVASKYSIMPDNFGTVLSLEDFNALLHYFTNQKN